MTIIRNDFMIFDAAGLPLFRTYYFPYDTTSAGKFIKRGFYE